jgi:acetyl esterase
LLSADLMAWFWEQYTTPKDAMHPYASPLLAEDLSGLPPALITTAAYDLLQDEGELCGATLRAAGVESAWHRCEGMVHGFMSLGLHLPPAQEALAQGIAMLNRYLRR